MLHFHESVYNWIPKTIWSRMNWFWGFCLIMAFFVDFTSAWTELCNNCSNLFFFRRHQVFLITSLKSIQVCSLNVPVLFSQRIWSSQFFWASVMQFNFLSYARVSSSSCFCASVDEITFDTSENLILRFPIFLFPHCLLIFYSVYLNSVRWELLMEASDAPARWWPCACLNRFSGPWTLEKIDFLEKHTCL